MLAMLLAAMLAALGDEGPDKEHDEDREEVHEGKEDHEQAVPGTSAYGHSERVGGLECDATDPCSDVLPGAVRFVRVEGKPYAEGLDAQGKRVGWVVLSNDVVDIKGYSGKPLSTLVGLTWEGNIAGGRVVHHSEPILLVGIPEQELQDFVGEYTGLPAGAPVTVGGESEAGEHNVDIVSGATVTVLAQNRTIIDSVKALAEDVGVLERVPAVPGHWVEEDEAWTWKEMEKRGVFGRLTVAQADMGVTGQGYQDQVDGGAFLDLWFTIADAPQVGKALLGEHVYARARASLAEGEHLVVILGNGTASFKGSGFVRGGIFDRVRVEQGLSGVLFRDLDYTNLSSVAAPDAPAFKEGALFVAREARLDPGRSFDLVFLGSRFDGKGGYSREFHTFKATHRMPKAVYALDGPDPESLIWRQAWSNNRVKVAITVAWLLAVMGVFAGRRWTTHGMARLQRIHLGFLLFAFLGGGLWLGVQPSVTQILTFVGSLVHEWRWGLFLSEPFLFVTWIFIAIVTIAWGRGVFCGWTCPYGAMSELLYKVGRLLRLPHYELPDAVHLKLRHLRYGILLALVGVYLWDPILGEKAAEVEPFKSTFFVSFWTREWYFAGWWLLLAGGSLFYWRPFCRYVCPLGAGLALPGSFRISGPYRRDFCSKCKICTRGCEPRAIRPDGTIDPRECLSCMECEANWRDDQVCPPLVKARRDRERGAGPGTP